MSGIRPRMFIGSSSEGLKTARAVAQQLQDQLEVTIWSSGVFGLGEGTLEAILRVAPTFDFGALVLTPDDMTNSRDVEQPSPRDNVIFEAGVFMGVLGRERAFLVFDADRPTKIPSDFAGITLARYRGRRADDSLVAAVDEACHLIRASVDRMGPVSRGLAVRASLGTRAVSDPTRTRKAIWFIGSSTELSEEATAFLRKLIPELCSRLVRLGCRIVVGDSPLLREIAVAYRSAMPLADGFVPNPVVVEGNLRTIPADAIFLETIGQVPTLAVVLGGSRSRGRVKEEYENARRSNIPVLSIKCTGGAAAELASTLPNSQDIDALASRDLRFVDSGELSTRIAEVVSRLP